MTFLDAILDETQKRIALLKDKHYYIEALDTLPETSDNVFYQALAKPGLSLIAELKKASPSKGVIREVFEPLSLAADFEDAGASALSVLTEPVYFKGELSYLERVSAQISLPTLRKDFILDERQIYEAKLAGASAVLLIVAILDYKQLNDLFDCATDLGLSVLVEVHSYQELESALSLPHLDIVGVNNRDLTHFETDTKRVLEMISQIKDERSSCLIVAESGYSTQEQLEVLEESGVDAVLIGEGLAKYPELLDWFNR